jgi:hypothetical protein
LAWCGVKLPSAGMTWVEMARPWIDYIARNSHMLQLE